MRHAFRCCPYAGSCMALALSNSRAPVGSAPCDRTRVNMLHPLPAPRRPAPPAGVPATGRHRAAALVPLSHPARPSPATSLVGPLAEYALGAAALHSRTTAAPHYAPRRPTPRCRPPSPPAAASRKLAAPHPRPPHVPPPMCRRAASGRCRRASPPRRPPAAAAARRGRRPRCRRPRRRRPRRAPAAGCRRRPSGARVGVLASGVQMLAGMPACCAARSDARSRPRARAPPPRAEHPPAAPPRRRPPPPPRAGRGGAAEAVGGEGARR